MAKTLWNLTRTAWQIDPATGDACLEPYRRRAEQLKKDYVHSLDRIWRESLEALGEPELGRFGPLITKIAQWEGYRYPVFRHGRSEVRTVTRGKGARVRHWGRDLVNRSEVNMAEVDELIASLVPAKYTVGWVRFQLPNQLALQTYLTDNAYPIPGVDDRNARVPSTSEHR